MDLENQKRVKEFYDQYGKDDLVVLLGAAEGEAAGLAAETVTLGGSVRMQVRWQESRWDSRYITSVNLRSKPKWTKLSTKSR